MLKDRFTKTNLNNIKAGFVYKVRGDGEEAAFTWVRRSHPALVMLAAALALSLSFGVLAATDVIDMSAVYRAVLGEGSEGSGFTINTTVVQNGIEFTLQSAVVDGNNGHLFFTVRDLTGDRLSGNLGWDVVTTKLHGLFKGQVFGGGIQELDYDQASKTLSAVMKLEAFNGLSLNDKLTLEFKRFETDVASSQDMDTGIDLQALLSERGEPQTTTEYADEFTAWSSHICEEMTKDELGRLPLLKKNELDITLPGIDSAIISNIGFVDGRLHIQMQETANTRTYSRGLFHLLLPDGSELYYKNSITMGNSGTHGNCYQEFIYDFAAPHELAGIKLVADITTSSGVVEGPWKFDFVIGSQAEERTFRLDSIAEESTKNVKIEASSISTVIAFDIIIDHAVTPEETITYQDELEEKFPVYKIMDEEAENYLKLADGSTIKLRLNRGGLDLEANTGDLTFFHSYYDINMLKAIVLNGVEHRLI